MEAERNANRLRSIEKQLTEYSEKLNFHEERLPRAESIKQEYAIHAEINEIKRKILQLEEEYSNTLISLQQIAPIPNEVAEELTRDIEDALKLADETEQAPPEILTQIRAVRAMVEESGKAATAKLKISIPIIPTLVSYELEADTEGVFTQISRKIKSLLGSQSDYIQSLHLIHNKTDSPRQSPPARYDAANLMLAAPARLYSIRKENEAIPGPQGFTYIDYPQLEGLNDEYLEERINRLLYREIVKAVEVELEEQARHSDAEADSEEWNKHYEDEVSYEITHQDNRYLSILVERFIDFGGAHPAHRTTAIVLDLETGYRYTLDDLFRTGKKYNRALSLLLRSNQITYADGEFFELPEDQQGSIPERDTPGEFDFFIKDESLVVFNLFSAYVNQAVWARIRFSEVRSLIHSDGPASQILNREGGS